MSEPKERVAILLPCYNEEIAIRKVIRDFKEALPEATIYVYDNNSKDQTAGIAREEGAIVRVEARQGKGHVVRRMFRDIDADWYLMADGDDTYDAALAPRIIMEAKRGGFDLVNCIRRETEEDAYRGGHRFGNRMLTGVVGLFFGNQIQDMLSGYKLFSHRFVKSFPVLSAGFDIETELAIHALELSLPVSHLEGDYKGRPSGSTSKLHTYRDGFRILRLIVKLIRYERPLFFFGVLAALGAALSIGLSVPVLRTYFQTGLVPRLPTAILSMGVMLVAILCFITGIILDTVTRGRRELRLLSYLQYPAPTSLDL